MKRECIAIFLGGWLSVSPVFAWQGALIDAQSPVVTGNGNTIIQYDTFTEGGANVFLSAHTPEIGTWDGTGDAASKLTDDATTDELKTVDSTTEYFWNPSSNPSSRNITMRMRAKTGTTGAVQFSLGFRDDSAGNFFKAKIVGDGSWTLFKTTSGSSVVAASGTIAGFSASTYYQLGLADSATTNIITVTIDDVVKFANADASFTANRGLFFGEKDTNVRIDSVTVTQN